MQIDALAAGGFSSRIAGRINATHLLAKVRRDRKCEPRCSNPRPTTLQLPSVHSKPAKLLSGHLQAVRFAFHA